MTTHKSSGEMKIVTKCERVQPTVVGVDANGELIWEGREMPDWQKALFLVKYAGDFLGHWMKARLAAYGIESEPDAPSMDISKVRKFGKQKPKTHQGD